MPQGPAASQSSLEPKIKRPLNAFMLFRGDMLKGVIESARLEGRKITMSEALKTIGDMWKTAPPWIKDRYLDQQQQAKEAHKAAHPDYKFTPVKKVKPDESTSNSASSGIRPSKSSRRRAKNETPVSESAIPWHYQQPSPTHSTVLYTPQYYSTTYPYSDTAPGSSHLDYSNNGNNMASIYDRLPPAGCEWSEEDNALFSEFINLSSFATEGEYASGQDGAHTGVDSSNSGSWSR